MIIGIDASRALRARRTGTERYSLEIIRHLLALPPAARHRWRLYTDVQPPSRLFPARTPGARTENVQVRRLSCRRLWTHTALAWEVVRRPPDVLFVPAHVIPFMLPRLLPPSVVTLHDVGYRYFPRAYTRFQRLYLGLSTRWSVAVARRVIAVSQFTADDLHCFYRAPWAKIRVIHEAPFPGERADADALGSPGGPWRPERPYALYVGTLQPRKNLLRLIDAYARLVRQPGVGWDLVLAGARGWRSADFGAFVEAKGVTGRVHFPGYVPDDALRVLMENALCFVFPSLFEGFGLPVLEAQEMGVPVMCANDSALPEIAGEAAILVDPLDVEAMADAMLRLSRDEALRQRLIAAGYENLKRFSWDKAARQTLAVLEEAARGGE